jgi:hypothetical protein
MFSSNEGMYEHLCRKEKIKLFFVIPQAENQTERKRNKNKNEKQRHILFSKSWMKDVCGPACQFDKALCSATKGPSPVGLTLLSEESKAHVWKVYLFQ